ncbi:hypothetical protein N8979_01095 [bacterium]|jgi:hypothetical protein|nr:hypothetical protein [bacterium]
MDTNNFDKHDKSQLAIYNSFMTGSKITVAFVILTLVVMAVTLL